MGKTTDLRKLITTVLNSVTGSTYYRYAPDNASYPYKTFEFSSINMGVEHRDDVSLVIDVWDNASNSRAIENIADSIEELFDSSNRPQTTILPTFFRDTRYPVTEQDKTIQHIQLTFLIENYKR